VQEQYVFTMTDGGFAKRSRITEYRTTGRGGLGIKAMTLTNEDRGGLVGAFIVEEGDEILSITQGGQVVRSPINEHFRATGRSTQGVKFVSFKSGDAVAVVARSVESREEDEVAAQEAEAEGVDTPANGEPTSVESSPVDDELIDELTGGAQEGAEEGVESPDEADGATIQAPVEDAEE
jgi:DNA gyrase subunit A